MKNRKHKIAVRSHAGTVPQRSEIVEKPPSAWRGFLFFPLLRGCIIVHESIKQTHITLPHATPPPIFLLPGPGSVQTVGIACCIYLLSVLPNLRLRNKSWPSQCLSAVRGRFVFERLLLGPFCSTELLFFSPSSK